MRPEILDWLSAGEDDLKTARILFENQVYYACAFYCQQGAEKALKALYLNEQKTGSASHNLISLARELNAPEPIIDSCRRLNPHYVQSRYPDAGNAIPADAYGREITQALLKHAREVFEWCQIRTMKKPGNSPKK